MQGEQRVRRARRPSGGRAVGAHDQRAITRDAECPGREEVDVLHVDGDRPVEACRGLVPRSALGAGQHGQARPDQVERGHRTGRAGDPEVGEATAEVGAQLLLRGPVGPLRISRAGDVVLGDRAPLGFVGVEEARIGPPVQHPGELPPEVEAVVDRRVHASGAAWRHPVGGVADQERVTLPEPFGQLGGEREAAGEQRCRRAGRRLRPRAGSARRAAPAGSRPADCCPGCHSTP